MPVSAIFLSPAEISHAAVTGEQLQIQHTVDRIGVELTLHPGFQLLASAQQKNKRHKNQQASHFYRSTAFVTLQKLNRDVYAEFITKRFRDGGFEIDSDAVAYILDWTRGHTYFTQRLCHTVYDMAHGKVDVALVKQAAAQILQSDSVVFGQYQQLLTAGQWNFLIAIAKEGEASLITSRQFLRKYHLGNPSSVSRIVPSLVEKNLLDENIVDGKTTYSLNDVFLSRWLEEIY